MNATRMLRLRRPSSSRCERRRAGISLVLFLVCAVVLVGMTGLVVDAGLLTLAHRRAYNAADAAALAAAMDLHENKSVATAQATGSSFVTSHNGLSTATVTVNIPPASGPYAGEFTHVEVLVTYPINTFFVQVLGINKTQTVSARAVAGYETYNEGIGVLLLDPTAKPGLDVSGNGMLKVDGAIIVNSQGAGEDENGDPVNSGITQPHAAKAGQPNSTTGLYARKVLVAGGVDKRENFNLFPVGATGPSPLDANRPLHSDPLRNLPPPTTALGLDATDRGKRDLKSGSTTLSPGIYESITISGTNTNVTFLPGIYVFKGSGGGDRFKVTGGNLTGNGVMFYNTGDNFDPVSGTPDIAEVGLQGAGAVPPKKVSGKFGGMSINPGTTSANFTPINRTNNPTVSPVFDGILFYQRRWNTETITLNGSPTVHLTGKLYAKWALLELEGEGNYGAQIIAGSMKVTGKATINSVAGGADTAPEEVFLVE